MAIKLINDDILQDIAEAIQEKDGGSKMTADQMASRITELPAGNNEIEDALITRSITTYENSYVTIISKNVFARCSFLTSANFPQVTIIGDNAFQSCSSLTSISFPQAINIGYSAFTGCYSLVSISFPQTTIIGNSAFAYCYSLASISFPQTIIIGNSAFFWCSLIASVSFPQVTIIGNSAFQSCRSLISIILGGEQSTLGNIYPYAFSRCYNLTDLHLQGSYLYSLSNSNAFTSTPIGGYSTSAGKYGSIYVPASLYDQYISATNWTYFSSRFVSVFPGPYGGSN